LQLRANPQRQATVLGEITVLRAHLDRHQEREESGNVDETEPVDSSSGEVCCGVENTVGVLDRECLREYV